MVPLEVVVLQHTESHWLLGQHKPVQQRKSVPSAVAPVAGLHAVKASLHTQAGSFIAGSGSQAVTHPQPDQPLGWQHPLSLQSLDAAGPPQKPSIS